MVLHRILTLLAIAGLTISGARADSFGVNALLEGHSSCGDTANPKGIDFARVAASLGANVVRGDCVYTIEELTELELRHDSLRDYQADWACVMLQDNFERDTFTECTPDTSRTFSDGPVSKRLIRGEMAYVGVYRKKYRYLISRDVAGQTLVELRIAFHGKAIGNPAVQAEMRAKLERAAQFWEAHAPGGRVHFKFVLVQPGAPASIDVPLTLEDERRPYDVQWTTQWDWKTVAHELGHVMGLDDEYNQLRNTMGLGKGPMARDRCTRTSLMCDNNSSFAVPKPYHYYLILRRMFCDEPDRFFNPLASAPR